jgi:hypothetical protein
MSILPNQKAWGGLVSPAKWGGFLTISEKKNQTAQKIALTFSFKNPVLTGFEGDTASIHNK